MTRADLKHCGKIPDAREELNRSVREGRIESRHSINSFEGMFNCKVVSFFSFPLNLVNNVLELNCIRGHLHVSLHYEKNCLMILMCMGRKRQFFRRLQAGLANWRANMTL